jgi:hypothetical protein
MHRHLAASLLLRRSSGNATIGLDTGVGERGALLLSGGAPPRRNG